MFDSLGQQATQMVQIGGELETAQHLNKLNDRPLGCNERLTGYFFSGVVRVRKEMAAQDKKQEAQIEEIKGNMKSKTGL